MSTVYIASLISGTLSELTTEALFVGILATTVLVLPFTILFSPVAVVLSPDLEWNTELTNIPLMWLFVWWFALFVATMPIVLLERFGFLLPVVVFVPVVNAIRFLFENEEALFIGVTAVLSPLLPLVYGVAGGLEYGLRRGVRSVGPITVSWPSVPDIFVGNWVLVAILGTLPLGVRLVAERHRTDFEERTIDEGDDGDILLRAPVPASVVSLLLVVAIAVVPVVLYASFGTFSPVFLVLFAVVPFGNALDSRGLRRRCLNYSLAVPAAVVCAIIESELRAFWLC